MTRTIPKSMTLSTKHPVARDSPDHLSPDAADRENNGNLEFVRDFQFLGMDFPLRILDLGCAGGQMVRDCLRAGHFAVGLEGTDTPQRNGRFHWPWLAGRSLFTCDVSQPFVIRLDDEEGTFDIVTMWGAIEHIPKHRLPILMSNVVNHLRDGGLFILGIGIGPSIAIDGTEHHLTQESIEWWHEMLSQYMERADDVAIEHPVRYDGPVVVYRKRRQ